MSSNIRTKTKPKNVEKAALVTSVIAVEDLQVHDRIATACRESNDGTMIATKTVMVDTLEVCPSQWRTHIHVNGRDCYDTRGIIRVVR